MKEKLFKGIWKFSSGLFVIGFLGYALGGCEPNKPVDDKPADNKSQVCESTYDSLESTTFPSSETGTTGEITTTTGK